MFAVITTPSVNKGRPLGMPKEFISDTFIVKYSDDVVLLNSEKEAKSLYNNLAVLSSSTRLKKVSQGSTLNQVVDFIDTLNLQGVINERVVLSSLLK